jgi:hypothetical protein
MCRELDALRRSVTTYAALFDPLSLSASQAGNVVGVCAQMEASIASLKALAAARLAEGDSWRREGYRCAADQLAHVSGVSPSSAKRTLETGRRMAGQPEVARAALAGELSIEQAAAVSDGAAANPAAAGDLLDKARRSSLGELYEEVARVKAGVVDQEARRKAIHAKRHFRRWGDCDGAFQAHLYGNPEDGARLWQMLDPIRRRLIVARRGSTPNEPLDALDYDALMTLAALAAGQQAEIGVAELVELGLFPQLAASVPPGRSAVVGGDGAVVDPPAGEPAPTRRNKLAFSPARVMIRVELDTLLRGVPLDGELCEIVGYGPVAVSVIEELLANGNAFVVGVLTRAQQVQGVFHHGRHPNTYQSTALDFLHPTCAVAGCSARGGLQSDHREEWAKTHYTVFDLLDRLCPHHHRLKTYKNWALVEGTGKRDFVPPGDPRHPQHPPAPTGPPSTRGP